MGRNRLIDLEELEQNILEPLDREYFHEAVECYSIGSYRAAAMLCWNLACVNMKRKLQKLSTEDGEAKKYWLQIETKEKTNVAFEEDLLNAFRSLDIFSDSEETAIKHTRTLRHYSAHPGEYKITAEEVRSSFRVIVDFILSRPYYRGYSFIHEIEKNLKEPSFLPDSGYEEVLKVIYSQIRPELLPKIADKVVQVMTNFNSDKTIRENSKKMLTCAIGHSVPDSIKHRIVAEISKLKDINLETLAHSFSMDSKSIGYLDFPTRERIIRHLIEEKPDIFGDFKTGRLETLTAFVENEIELNNHKEWVVKLVKEKIRKIPELVSMMPEHFAQFAYEKVVTDLEYSGWSNFETNNGATVLLRSFTLKAFSSFEVAQKTRLIAALFSASTSGSKQPTEFLLNFPILEKEWQNIYDAEIETRIASGEIVPTVAFAFIVKKIEQSSPWKSSWNILFQPRSSGDVRPIWFRGSYKVTSILEELETFQSALCNKAVALPELENLIAALKEPQESRAV